MRTDAYRNVKDKLCLPLGRGAKFGLKTGKMASKLVPIPAMYWNESES
jgi:hypothetical protein